MMPVVRISDQTWIRLKQHAQPFEDTPEKIINLALDALDQRLGSSSKNSEKTVTARRKLRKNKGDKLPQKEFYTPLLLLVHKNKGRIEVSKARQLMEQQMKPFLRADDYEPVKNGDPRWWNATCWERKRLVMEGLFADDSERGIWELTEAGIEAAEKIKSRE